MLRDDFDRKISDALKRATDDSSAALHKETLKRTLDKIDQIEKGDKKMPKKKPFISRTFSVGAAALAVFVAVTFSTQPGQAAWERVRQYFEPEKTIVTEIEGTEEEIDGKLQESEMGYVLYYDQDRYQVEALGDLDVIAPLELPDYIPEVYMEISQVTGRSPSELALEIERELNDEFTTVLPAKEVDSPLPAIMIYAEMGSEWDDAVVRYYLVDNTQGGAFVVKQVFFLEATEGHGARFDSMLREFTIVELE